MFKKFNKYANSLKEIAEKVTFSLLFLAFLGSYLIFVATYLNPEKISVITIDNFGEANLELVMLSTILATSIYFVGSKLGLPLVFLTIGVALLGAFIFVFPLFLDFFG